ncbi:MULTISPECIES: hypothetical protein [Acidithiobacillus]|jgi:DNA repair exonuclease SbcCD ATPase subunit|uniref:hypothetical protein n=1 Tax=Acidithiobacillus TaxID=119977 RepID=UPI000B1F6283|nr:MULTISPECIES: hypothetical protein [Acidithiobacillus]MCE5419361.1 hypothetical protein [Acidithiobacillus sp.]MCY0871156.1 hypothetical protein [Acidithiobacillus caldus]WMT47976.1 MAG: hypothetical protein RE468_05030 [Acidithiobacillus caldus]
MDYQVLDQQYNQLQQQTQNNIQALQQVAQRVQAVVPDNTTARELILDLRNLAMNLQQQQQSTAMMLQQLSMRIQQLEMQLQSMGQTGVNPNVMGQRAWNQPMQPGMGSSFLGNVATGLGLGAGFGIAENVVDDIFNSF